MKYNRTCVHLLLISSFSILPPSLFPLCPLQELDSDSFGFHRSAFSARVVLSDVILYVSIFLRRRSVDLNLHSTMTESHPTFNIEIDSSNVHPKQDHPDQPSHSTPDSAAGNCLACKREPITYMSPVCKHPLFCRKCAMKCATGGKCKVCGTLYPSLARWIPTTNSDSDDGKDDATCSQ